MQIEVNEKILVACFLVPFLAPFPLQFLRHCFATGYGGYFDQPGLGWVVFFGCIMGGLAGLICASLYLAFAAALSKSPWCLGFLVLALALTVPLVRFQSNDAENERDRFIRWVAYQLFYAPFVKPAPPVDTPVPAGFPVCIPPHTRVQAMCNNGQSFTISTGKGVLRTYTWAGGSRSLAMIPISQGQDRELNFPCDLSKRPRRWPGFDWKLHDGVARCCSLEQVLDFDSEREANEWIRSEQDQGIPFAYRNDGLVILVSKHIEPDTIWVMVHQLLIKGRKPIRLPGAEDAKIGQENLI